MYKITFKDVFVYLGKSKLVCRKRADICNRIFSIFAVAWNHGGSSNNACHRHSQRRYSNDELGMVNIINCNDGNVCFLGKIIRATNATKPKCEDGTRENTIPYQVEITIYKI